jgi:hypothetical protein
VRPALSAAPGRSRSRRLHGSVVSGGAVVRSARAAAATTGQLRSDLSDSEVWCLSDRFAAWPDECFGSSRKRLVRSGRARSFYRSFLGAERVRAAGQGSETSPELEGQRWTASYSVPWLLRVTNQWPGREVSWALIPIGWYVVRIYVRKLAVVVYYSTISARCHNYWSTK